MCGLLWLIVKIAYAVDAHPQALDPRTVRIRRLWIRGRSTSADLWHSALPSGEMNKNILLLIQVYIIIISVRGIFSSGRPARLRHSTHFSFGVSLYSEIK